MANPTWPTDLPQNPFGFDDPTYTPKDNILRTQQEGGASTSRVLFTAPPETLPVRLQLSPAQRASLRTFLVDTVKYVLPFDWIDFRTGAAATYVYAGTALPAETYLGEDASGTWWQVQFELELQP